MDSGTVKSMETANGNRERVICPICGYKMPIEYDPSVAKCNGVFVKCKGRSCGRIFEIVIEEESDK